MAGYYQTASFIDYLLKKNLSDALLELSEKRKTFDQNIFIIIYTFHQTETGKLLMKTIDKTVDFVSKLEQNTDCVFDHNLVCYSLVVSDAKDATKNLSVFDKLYVKESNIHGRGVFCKERIEKYKLVDIYPSDAVVSLSFDNLSKRGVLSTKSSEFEFEKCNLYSCEPSLKLGDYLIGPIGDKNKADVHKAHLINESKRSNCELYSYNGIYYIFTIEDIEKDEELTVDYGISYKHRPNN